MLCAINIKIPTSLKCSYIQISIQWSESVRVIKYKEKQWFIKEEKLFYIAHICFPFKHFWRLLKIILQEKLWNYVMIISYILAHLMYVIVNPNYVKFRGIFAYVKSNSFFKDTFLQKKNNIIIPIILYWKCVEYYLIWIMFN